jgi:hypothetical protein
MWTFCNSTGGLRDPFDNFVENGYSGGNCGKNPEGRNNPAMCGVKNIGPIPCGTYTMETPILHSHLGPFAIPLTPDPDNDMRGRGGFFVHGDTTPSGNASEGCIILSRGTREKLWNSINHQIQVI